MSHSRLDQLRELQNIIEEISQAIIWVNEREEEELIFDWGDKNIDYYIPKKQESYSVRIAFSFFLMSCVFWFSGHCGLLTFCFVSFFYRG